MSLFLCHHDLKRACCVSDDRAISFGEGGEVVPMDMRAAKFITIGGLIFACLGTSDVCAKLNNSFQRMLGDHPELSVTQLRDILPPGLASTFAKRRQDPGRPMGFDNLEVAVLGYDAQAKRMRSFAFVATDGFKPVETSAGPYNRIFALGHYNATDTALLQRLTAKMKVADGKGLPWIAAQLRDALSELHEKYSLAIGQPSFFAAIDRNGAVELPEDFPPAPVPEAELATASSHVATTKEVAFAGTTRFFVGSVITPVAGGPDTIGNNDGGSSATVGMVTKLSLTQVAAGSGTFGTGSTLSNASSGIDNNAATFCDLKASGNGTNNSAFVTYYGPPGLARKYSSVTLKLNFTIVQNNLNFSAGLGQDGIVLTGVNNLMQSPTGNYLSRTFAAGSGAQANQTLSVTIPPTDNLGGLNFSVFVGAVAGATAGGIEVKFYEAWIEAIE